MHNSPTIMSLFDGSGGFPLAASICGIVPTYASEIEPYPIAVTRSRFPGMIHLGSVTEIHGDKINPVDVITFGSPCQDLSVAGKRAGLKHENKGDDETTRSGLFMEAVRIIKEMREATNGAYPAFAVWENVPGAFSSNKGEDFRTVLEELIRIVEPTAVMPSVPKAGWAYADIYRGDGWSLAYRVFDAQYWGVPQRRRRIYLVLDLRGERAGKALFEREGLRGYFAESGAQRETTSSNVERGSGTADVPYTLKIRSECEGGGKGALVQTNKSATLSTLNDQYLFQPISVKTWDARGNGDGDICNTITDDHENRITDYSSVICLQGNGIDRADTAGCNGKGWKEGICYTPNTIDRPAVAYTMQGFGDYKDCGIGSGLKARDYKDATDLIVECAGVDCRNITEHPELYPTLQAKPNGGQSLNFSGAVRVRYIVRRLTPTECARLQGFPDKWGHPDQKAEFSDEEYEFWLNARNTHAAINGKQTKEYTKDQMLTWYSKLHTDSSEYKMWGNGIALPCALYVMEGISECLSTEK